MTPAPYEEAKKNPANENRRPFLLRPRPSRATIFAHPGCCQVRQLPIPSPPQRKKQCGNSAGLRDCILPKINPHSHLPSFDTVSIDLFAAADALYISQTRHPRKLAN
jgi:hypothetical protein